MNRRTALVAALVFIVVVGGVQLLDPQFGERSPPEVDYSEPPAEVAADAATQFEYVDYAYRIDIADNRSGEWEQVRVMMVEHSDHEYWKAGPIGNRGVVIYGTDAITFVRPGSDSPWRVTPIPETVYPARSISQPFITESIRNSNGSIVAENESKLIIHIDSNPLKITDEYVGNATIYVSTDSGLVEEALIEYQAEPRGTRYLRFQLTEDETSVERPSEIPFSPREVIWDLLRGPLFRIWP